MNTTTANVVIETVAPLDAATLNEAYDVMVAVMNHDLPGFPVIGRHRHVARFARPFLGFREILMVARDDGRIVGWALLNLNSLENKHIIGGIVRVVPDRRREGIGTKLVAAIHAFGAAEGRSRLFTDIVIEAPGSTDVRPAYATARAFLSRLGTGPAYTEVRRRLDLDRVDTTGYAALAEDAWKHATGYSLVQWRDRTPDEIVADVAALETRLEQDQPLGDLDMERATIDVARIRDGEEARIARGDRVYFTAARHDATGALVAMTVIAMEEGVDDHAWQLTTVVEPPHRGHRLGFILKIENLAVVRAAEPAVRTIDTYNAASNSHMIAVNEMMGFVAMDAVEAWDLPVLS